MVDVAGAAFKQSKNVTFFAKFLSIVIFRASAGEMIATGRSVASKIIAIGKKNDGKHAWLQLTRE